MDKTLERLSYLASKSDFTVKKRMATDAWGNEIDEFSHYEIRKVGCNDFMACADEEGITYIGLADNYDHEINPQDLLDLMEFCTNMSE